MPTITSATSGPSNATSTWVGGVVPVVGDKVIIARNSTNAATPYVLSGAHSAGATSLLLTIGSGTIVAGESIQLEHQVGTDESGEPIFSNAYYRVATGITAPGQSLVIDSPGLVAAMASGTRVVAMGHVVTLAADHTWGDDTSGSTAGSNGVVLSGTLLWPRNASRSLTLRGTLWFNNNGTLDIAQRGDTNATGVSHTLIVNDSAALSAGKHCVMASNTANAKLRAFGPARTRNTTLAAPVAVSATSISVAASLDWSVGDVIAIEADGNDPTRVETVTLTGGSHPNWTCTTVTRAKPTGTRVANLSSRITIRSASASHPGFVSLFQTGLSTTGECSLGFLTLQNLGSSSGWTSLSLISAHTIAALGVIGLSMSRKINLISPSFFSTANANQLGMGGLSPRGHRAEDVAIFAASGLGLYFHTAAVWDVTGIVYSSTTGVTSSSGEGTGAVNITGAVWSTLRSYTAIAALSTQFVNSRLVSSGTLIDGQTATVGFQNCTIFTAVRLFQASAVGSIWKGSLVNCTFEGANTLGASVAVGAAPSQNSRTTLVAVNGNAGDNRVRSYWVEATTDSSTRRRSTYSVSLRPNVANAATTYTFAIPAVAGVAQTIRGSLRFDATYGTTTPPRFDLAGQGVTASFVAPAAADTWHDFALTFTPTTTGDITATVTVQSASTTGFAWLDGIYHFPMTQSVRHFGFQWLPQAAQIADPRITLTEAAALALPVVEDHTAQTITVSGPVTARQVFEAAMADLCQTANQTRAVHISSATGATFATSYTVVLIGAGAISGVYTDAGGVRVQIVAPALIAGSRVQLYNVTDSTEMFNGVLSADGLVFNATWGTNKVIRLRAEHNSKLPLQTIGVLTSSGLSFLDVQGEDSVYLSNGIDGSTCTEFVADGANVQIDINDPDGVTSVQRLYAWMQWYQTTSAGIASAFFGAVNAIDAASYTIDQAMVDIKLDNVGATPVRVVGGYLSRKDGSTIISATSGSIQMDPGKAYVAGMSAPIVLNPGERLLTTSAGNLYAR